MQAATLNDRLIQGETPDLYIGTAIEVQQAAQDGTLPDEQVDFGEDTVVMIVPPGNPAGVATLDVFGPLDALDENRAV